MHLHLQPNPLLLLLTTLLAILPLSHAQNAAAGGGAGAVVAPIQYPVVINGPSLLTQAGTVTTVQQAFTQTFVTPLATWAFPTPAVGSVGLGNIQGTVGAVKSG